MIRALDGFSSFGLPPPASELLAQGQHGPVVTFTVSRRRSAALILAHDGIDLVELPSLRYQDLIDQIGEFRQALDASISVTREDFDAAQARLGKVLEWLWDKAAEPVLRALGIAASSPSSTPLPQVWWAPGGLLGQLPIHAAGYHVDPPDRLPRRTVMDYVISSYTPTVRALRYSREHTVAREITPRSLIVAMPSTPGLPGLGKLVHVAAEAARLSELLPNPVTLIEDDGTDEDNAPTKIGILNLLPEVQVAHFACHGHSNPADPSQSFLLLRDHSSDPLTVASLVPVSLGQAQLAYLSACSTAITSSPELADEAIHLASAFQLAGFPHVIGTLWEINDYIAVTVAERFYTCLRAESGEIEAGRAARCLHAAIRTIRNRRPNTPFLWASYLHAGA
jgi:CHAT domain